MPWVLLANDRIIEIESSGTLSLLRLGDEVPAVELHGPQNTGDQRPGILIGYGLNAGLTPQEQSELPPNRLELDELISNVRARGSGLMRGPHFADHYDRHRNLLEAALGRVYPLTTQGEDAFLSDLGQLITDDVLKPIGIATINRGQPMVYIYTATVGSTPLTAVVRPCGEWNTLLRAGTGRDLGLQFQMRFDANFPFPFMQQRSTGGFRRNWL